jgi:uncharacterized protein (DUF486 family)
MKSIATIGLLIITNIFVFMAWYGPLKFKELKWMENKGMFTTILVTWAIAFFICLFQLPANKLGYSGNNGPFSLIQLKLIQEVISLIVFVVFTLIFFKNEVFRWNHAIGAIFLVLAVYFMFKK